MLTIIDPLLVIIALIICIAGFVRRYRFWMMGRKDEDLTIDKVGSRIKDFFLYGIFHGRTLKEMYPGLMHLFIFFACFIPFLIIVSVQIKFALPDFFGNIFSVFLDIVGLLGLAGIAFAAFRRYVQKPDRLSDTQRDDAVALIWIFAIIFLGFCIEGLRLRITGEGGQWSPVGVLFSYVFAPFGSGVQVTVHHLLWRIHFFLVLGLIALIPYTKFLHIITSPINIFLQKYGPPGVIRPIHDFETAETFGAATLEELTHNQLFQLDACTRCGRCQDNCPAYLSDKPLSPKKLLQDLKAHMEEKAAGENGKTLIGDVIEHETLWACTMCLNCHAQCPVFETTVDKTIEMRRYLVLMESNISGEVQTVLRNLENNSNPWGVGSHQRADWAKKLDVKLAADEQEFDILFYVGCAGAYDDRYQKVAIATTKILQKAGINFAILGAEEGCCGDSARRIGNEYLYETLVQHNLETLKQYRFKKILTMCPHCFNSLKNEYPQHGGEFDVIHTSEFFSDLINQGKIQLNSSPQPMTVCYHDSCLLGRYNNIYDQPRKVLKSISGIKLTEMDRNMDRSFCCGAGGGRMWMEEDIGQRINEMRTDQALEKNPDAIITACPYCLTMIDDGIKVREKTESIKSLDIAEILCDAMK